MLKDSSLYLNSILRFLDIKLPKNYSKYLLEKELFDFSAEKKRIFNDIRNQEVISALDHLYNFSDSSDYDFLNKIKSFESRIPDNMVPIGCDGFGNQILLSIKGPDYGKVYFWDHEMEAGNGEEPSYDNLTLIANSFDEFMNSLHSEEEHQED